MRNNCLRVRAIDITYSACLFVALCIYRVKRVCHIILPSIACLAVPFISKVRHKPYDFREKSAEHKMCVLIFSANLSETFFVLRRIQRDKGVFKKRPNFCYKDFIAHFTAF